MSQSLTADETAILTASRRITGSRLQAGELFARRGTAGVAEVRHRAGVGYTTAIEAIDNLRRQEDPQAVVLYFSGGYDLDSVPEPAQVISAAWRAQAIIHTFHIPELIEQMPPLLPGLPPAGWDAYERITMNSLRMLATRTGGIPIESRNWTRHSTSCCPGCLAPASPDTLWSRCASRWP